MKICVVAGARPNFMKIAPIVEALRRFDGIETVVVHTGQHYDREMSDSFFHDLEMDPPDVFLGVGSGLPGEQTGKIMMAFEKTLIEEQPELVLVVGDVNSTLACGLTAVKMGIKMAHYEAGLRSFDRSMPEEINRVLTDAIADFLFITEPGARENLLKEGVSDEKIYFVGNVMIDTLMKFRDKSERSAVLENLGLARNGGGGKPVNAESPYKGYALLTLHRPSNVDDRATFSQLIDAMLRISSEVPVVFPVHPRTMGRVREFGFDRFFNFIETSKHPVITADKINAAPPLGYLDFLKLMSHASLVLTDSGGIQEETTILGVPCITVRENTERPITVLHGTNRVVGTKKSDVIRESLTVLREGIPNTTPPPLWDGKAAQRTIDILMRQRNNEMGK